MTKSNSETRLVALAAQLRDCLKADAKNIYTYGAILTEANRILEHGKWGPWLEDFGISEQSALNYMAVHRFKLAVTQMPAFKSLKFGDLKLRPSAIYMLAELLADISKNAEEGTGEMPGGSVWNVWPDIDIADIEAVLVAAKDAWLGPKRLEAILNERHPVEAPADEPDDGDGDGEDEAGEDEAGEDEPTPRPRQPREPELSPRVAAWLRFATCVDGLWRLCEEVPSSALKSPRLQLEQVEGVIALLTEVAKLLRPAGSAERPIETVKAAHEAAET